MNQTGMLHRAICTFHLLQIAMFSSSSDGDIKKNKSLTLWFSSSQSRVHLKVSGSEHASPWQGTGRHLWSHEAATTSNKLARRGLWPGQADPRLGRGQLGPLKHLRHLCPMVKCDSSGCRARCWLDAGGDPGEGGNTASLKHLRHLRGDLWAASRQPPASCGPLLPARFSCGQKLFT